MKRSLLFLLISLTCLSGCVTAFNLVPMTSGSVDSFWVNGRQAGLVIDGFASVEAAIARETLACLVEASDGAADGRRKLLQAVKRRFGESEALPLVAGFDASQLSLALGRGHVIHACLKSGRASTGFLERADRLERFRTGRDAKAPLFERADIGL